MPDPLPTYLKVLLSEGIAPALFILLGTAIDEHSLHCAFLYTRTYPLPPLLGLASSAMGCTVFLTPNVPTLLITQALVPPAPRNEVVEEGNQPLKEL